MSIWKTEPNTPKWKGRYYGYDIIKEGTIAVIVIGLLAIGLTILFSSPDDKPSTIAQWSTKNPTDFVGTAIKELDGTSGTAEYGPPYNHSSAAVQHFFFLHPQRWLGVSHPINTELDYVVEPLETETNNDAELAAALAKYKAAPEKQKKEWAEAYAKPLEEREAAQEENKPLPSTVKEVNGNVVVTPSGDAGPVPVMMEHLLKLAQNKGLDGAVLTSKQYYQTDYTKPLLLMADGGLLAERAEEQHLLGKQWGLMNETGSFPGQPWLWLYALWYQVEPIKTSPNADIQAVLIISVLSLAFLLIPVLPGINRIPRWIPIYKLIWREHYRNEQIT